MDPSPLVFLGIACGVIVGGLVLILLFVGVAITLVDWCSCNKSYSKSAFVRQSWDETTEDFYRSADVGRDSCEIESEIDSSSIANSRSRKETYYHYTTPEAAEQIMKSGRLNKSCGTNGRDAVFGYGVYLTKMAPEFGKLRIAKNNWDGYTRRVEQLVDSRRVDAVVRLELDPYDVIKADDAAGRDIYLYPDDLIITNDMKARIVDSATFDELDAVD